MIRGPKSASALSREAFFLDFAKEIRGKFRNVPLMVTGGFRSREAMENALREDACDIVGIGRPAVLNPNLPKNLIFNKEVKSQDAKAYARKAPDLLLPKLLGIQVMSGGAETVSRAVCTFDMMTRKDSLIQMIEMVYEANAIDVSSIAALSFVNLARKVFLSWTACIY